MEAQPKTCVDEEKMEEGNKDLSQALEVDSPLDSVVKPVVEAVTQTAESLMQNVADHSSSYIARVEREFGNLGLVQESLIKGISGGESLGQENADLDESSRTTDTQPFVATNAASRASWTSCCGLLDVLWPSDRMVS